jgi:hypothetical protein
VSERGVAREKLAARMGVLAWFGLVGSGQNFQVSTLNSNDRTNYFSFGYWVVAVRHVQTGPDREKKDDHGWGVLVWWRSVSLVRIFRIESSNDTTNTCYFLYSRSNSWRSSVFKKMGR